MTEEKLDCGFRRNDGIRNPTDPFEFFSEGLAGVVLAVYEPDLFWWLRHGFYPVDQCVLVGVG